MRQLLLRNRKIQNITLEINHILEGGRLRKGYGWQKQWKWNGLS